MRCELALAHLFHLGKSAVSLDEGLELLNESSSLFLGLGGVNDIHYLVVILDFCHDCTSFWTYGPLSCGQGLSLQHSYRPYNYTYLWNFVKLNYNIF